MKQIRMAAMAAAIVASVAIAACSDSSPTAPPSPRVPAAVRDGTVTTPPLGTGGTVTTQSDTSGLCRGGYLGGGGRCEPQ